MPCTTKLACFFLFASFKLLSWETLCHDHVGAKLIDVMNLVNVHNMLFFKQISNLI